MAIENLFGDVLLVFPKTPHLRLEDVTEYMDDTELFTGVAKWAYRGGDNRVWNTIY